LERVVGHFDLDYFYAQVEEVENPSLRDRPVVVCVFSGRTEDSGVVSTANYKAREFGVHSGMPIVLAKKKLESKDPAIIRMEHEKYESVSTRIMERLDQLVDVLEPTGIDEAFFEITSSADGDYAKGREIAESIKKSVFESERLTSSIGLGRSKVVAKLGSDLSKPDGLTVITPEKTTDFLGPLPVGKLYGVGPKTSASLEEMGIRTVADLARAGPSDLEQHFGRKFGAYLLAAATGTDDAPVVAGLEPTQFSRIVTLKKDIKNPHEVVLQLSSGIDYIDGKLTASKMSFRTVSAIGILTDLSTKTRSKTFETPVVGASILREEALTLFEELGSSVNRDFRRAGIRVSGLARIEDQSSLSEFVGTTG
jgi:DNA polymerase IV (archaeal DinB-like DNA polymerase)